MKKNLFILFLFPCILFAQSAKKISSEQLLAIEERLFLDTYLKSTDYTLQYIDSLKKETNHHPEVIYSIGKYWTFFNYNKAEEEFLSILNQKISKKLAARTNYSLGNVSYNLKKYQSALNYLLAAEQLKYDKEKVYMELGYTYLILSKNETAEKYFGNAFEINSLPAIIGLLGVVYEMRSKYKDAIEFYEIADRAYFKNVPIYSINLIQLYKKIGAFAKAKEVAHRALENFPNNNYVLKELMEIYQKLGDLDSLEIYLQKQRNVFPHYANDFGVLGDYYDEVGKLDSAVYFYKISLELNPEDVSTIVSLSNILSKLGLYREAHQFIDQGMKIEQEDYYLYINKIYAYMWEQKLDSCYFWTIKMAENLPKRNLDFVIGYSSLLYGKYDDAVYYFKKEIKSKPKDDRVNNNLGRAYFKLGVLDSAEYFINKALSIQPKNAFALHNRAALNLKLNKIQEACNDLEEAINNEYTGIVDDELKVMAKQHCSHIETNYVPAIKEYKLNRKGLKNVNFYNSQTDLIKRIVTILNIDSLYEKQEKLLEKVKYKHYSYDYFLHFMTIEDVVKKTITVDFVYSMKNDFIITLYDEHQNIIFNKEVKYIAHEKIDVSKLPTQKYILVLRQHNEIVTVLGF